MRRLTVIARASVRLAGFVTLAVAAGGASHLAAQEPVRENTLKAAIVAKLLEFVDWPAAVLEGRKSIDLCVAGHNPFQANLQELEAGETLKGLPIAVRSLDRTRQLDGCAALVLPAGSVSRTLRAPLLHRAAALPVLTMGDDDRFLDEGGIVRLRVVDGHPRFDVDEAAARRVGLRISSKLLELAATVRRGPS